jgi:hypothetical protein
LYSAGKKKESGNPVEQTRSYRNDSALYEAIFPGILFRENTTVYKYYCEVLFLKNSTGRESQQLRMKGHSLSCFSELLSLSKTHYCFQIIFLDLITPSNN